MYTGYMNKAGQFPSAAHTENGRSRKAEESDVHGSSSGRFLGSFVFHIAKNLPLTIQIRARRPVWLVERGDEGMG